MLTNTDDGTRNFVIDPIALIVDYAANILAKFGGNIDRLIDAADDDEEEEVCSFTANQVGDFIQTLVRLEISTLQADDTMCEICKFGYAK